MACASTSHVSIEISFKPDYNYLRKGKIAIPDSGTYGKAVGDFVNTFACGKSTCKKPAVPKVLTMPVISPAYPAAIASTGMKPVTAMSAWGEPDYNGTDDPGQQAGFAAKFQHFLMPKGNRLFSQAGCSGAKNAGTCGPSLAAAMWDDLQSACNNHSCKNTVIAGDFGSYGPVTIGPNSYLQDYAKSLKGKPHLWGIHPYSDVENAEHYYQGVVPGHTMACKTKKGGFKPLPPLSDTLVGKFAATLHALKYGSSTHIWLNEVTAFVGKSMLGTPEPCWNYAVQADAAAYLVHNLEYAGGGGEPTVSHVYYLNFSFLFGGPNYTHPLPIYYLLAARKTRTKVTAPAFKSSAAASFVAGVPHTFAISTKGFPVPTITESGALPSGLTFTADAPGSGTATISGTPARGDHGTTTVVLSAANQVGPEQGDKAVTPTRQSLSITVTSPPPVTPPVTLP